ncbi:head-tail joining protein [Tardiphaga sp. 20_F10_N6_6]|uniref:head-tail joining protein n=1 Tax=Tardiphaga sp. 20_F10_N6_6 TaxID=3240788 RepID=UPI003F8C430B
MPAPSWENLDDFLQPESGGDFAILAAITLQGTGQVLYVHGIFDDPYLNAQLGEYEADTSAPRFTCKEVDVPDVDRGDYWQQVDEKTRAPIGDRFSIMTQPQQDGTGIAILHMEPM